MRSFINSAISFVFNFSYGKIAIPIFKGLLRQKRYTPPTLSYDYKKVLVNFQKHDFIGLGDAVIFSSLFKILKYRFPEAKLYLLTNAQNKHLNIIWKDHTYVDEFLVHPPLSPRYFFHWLAFYYKLTKSDFDLSIIQAHKSVVNKVRGSWFPLDPLLTYLCGIREIIGFYDRWPQDIVFSKIIDQFGLSGGKTLDNIPHWSDIAFEYAMAISLRPEDHSIALKKHVKFDWMKLPYDSKIMIAINPGGDKNFDRRWPLEKFKDLCISLSAKYDPIIFLVGGPDETDIRTNLVQAVLNERDNVKIHNIIAGSLNETLNYIGQSNVFIGNDTGTTHLAAAIDEPNIVAIFGPTDPTYWGPENLSSRHQVIALEIPCRPCDLLYDPVGHKDCYLTTNKHKCLRDLSTEKVLRAVENSLGLSVK